MASSRNIVSISKRKAVNKILEIAENKKKTDEAGKFWYVKQEMFAKYDVDETQEWKYILELPNKKEEEVAASRPESPA